MDEKQLCSRPLKQTQIKIEVVLRAGFINNEHCHNMMKKYNFTRVSPDDFF